MTLAWVIVGCAIAFIGVAKSGFGGGLGLIVVPICSLALPYAGNYNSEDALGLLLPLLLTGDLIAVWQYRGDVCWRIVRRLTPGMLVGIVLGTLLIALLKSNAALAAALVNLEIGLESVLLVGLTWYRQWHGRPHKLMPEPWRSLGTSAFAGTSSTLAHAAGPIVAMYLVPLNLGRLALVGTSATFFLLTNAAKLPAYASQGLFHRISIPFALAFAPLVLAGAVFGRWLCRKMSDRVFSQCVYVTVFVLGIYLTYKGLSGIL